MVKEMVDELVSMVESTSVVGMIMDSLIEVSSFVGEVNVVWNNLLNDDMLKEAIMKKLEQEDKDNTMMLECQIREERLLKQKNARDAWMTAKINKDVSFLIDSLSKIELEKEDDLNYIYIYPILQIAADPFGSHGGSFCCNLFSLFSILLFILLNTSTCSLIVPQYIF